MFPEDLDLQLPDDAYEWMLTTIDNPYSPFTKWNEWLAWDIQSGYNTCGYLSRIAMVNDKMPDSVTTYQTVMAMREIVRLNLSGKHKIAKPNDKFKVM